MFCCCQECKDERSEKLVYVFHFYSMKLLVLPGKGRTTHMEAWPKLHRDAAVSENALLDYCFILCTNIQMMTNDCMMMSFLPKLQE